MAVSNVSWSIESVITFYWEKDVEVLCSGEDRSIQAVPQVDLVPSQQYAPDRGLLAWKVVLGGFCCMFCTFGWMNCKL